MGPRKSHWDMSEGGQSENKVAGQHRQLRTDRNQPSPEAFNNYKGLCVIIQSKGAHRKAPSFTCGNNTGLEIKA